MRWLAVALLIGLVLSRMRLLVVALLATLALFACAQAFAQTNPCASVPQAVAWTSTPFKPLACAPDLSPSSPLVRQLRAVPGKGYVAWWSCIGPDGAVAKQAAVLTAQELIGSAAPAVVADALLQLDPAEALRRLNAVYVANGGLAWTDPQATAVWCPYERELAAFLAAPAPPPVPETWLVAKNGLLASRPYYPVVDGKRVATVVGATAVGGVCDCSAPILEGPTPWSGVQTYCPAAGMPTQTVTLCTRP